MPLIDSIKEKVEKITGLGRPTRQEVDAVLRPRKASVFRFADDGIVPNNGKLPLILYRGPIRTAGAPDPAALFEALFERNGWKGSWRNSIYEFVHYHSQIHEVLGIARGHVTVRFGGSRGRAFKLDAGDVAILPAGTGHKRIDEGDDLLVVGAYPAFGKYDLCRGSREEHERAVKTVPKVPIPRKDPVYGSGGPLLHVWHKSA